jgi:hypothetical protein
MAIQVTGATFLLNKWILVSNYVGFFPLKFNPLTNQFEKLSKPVNIIKFVCSLILNIVYLVCADYFFHSRPCKIFILKIAGVLCIYSLILLTLSVTVFNKKYASVTIATLNKLYTIHMKMDFKCKKSMKAIVLLSYLLADAGFRFVVSFLRMFSISKANAKIQLSEVGGKLIVDYGSFLRMLFEGRLLLTYLAIAQSCDCFKNRFNKNGVEALDKYKELLEVAKNTNEMFSPIFLICIAFYFVHSLVHVITLYCGLHDHQENFQIILQLFGSIFAASKIILIVLIPNYSMVKVKYCKKVFKRY